MRSLYWLLTIVFFFRNEFTCTSAVSMLNDWETSSEWLSSVFAFNYQCGQCSAFDTSDTPSFVSFLYVALSLFFLPHYTDGNTELLLNLFSKHLKYFELYVFKGNKCDKLRKLFLCVLKNSLFLFILQKYDTDSIFSMLLIHCLMDFSMLLMRWSPESGPIFLNVTRFVRWNKAC